MKELNRILLIILSIIVIKSRVYAQNDDNWMFNPTPSSSISGAPSSTIGWGYSVSNNSPSFWLLLAKVYSDVQPQYGTFNDILGFPVVKPNSTAVVEYQSTSGLISLTWNSDAPVGYSLSGSLSIQGYWYDADPYDFDNPGNFIGDAGERNASFQATVTQSHAPEPNSLSLAIAVAIFTMAIFCGFRIGSKYDDTGRSVE